MELRSHSQKEEGRRHYGSEERAPRARCLLQRRGRWWALPREVRGCSASVGGERAPLLVVEEEEVGLCCLREVR